MGIYREESSAEDLQLISDLICGRMQVGYGHILQVVLYEVQQSWYATPQELSHVMEYIGQASLLLEN